RSRDQRRVTSPAARAERRPRPGAGRSRGRRDRQSQPEVRTRPVRARRGRKRQAVMAWDSVHPFECPTRVFYGRGASHAAGEHLRELGVEHALIVSDRGVADAGIVDSIVERLRAAGVEASVYAGTQPNPTTTNVAEAAAMYRVQRRDGAVALGGGSSIDSA